MTSTYNLQIFLTLKHKALINLLQIPFFYPSYSVLIMLNFPLVYMNKKSILFFLLGFALAFISACSHLNTQQVLRFKGDHIPHYKYELENGLTVILHQDTSDPLVNVNVTYHVGSAREDYGRSGFAHFFEHMMFQGSLNVEDERHFKIITEAGGTLNGTTNTDRTNYFQTVPANQLEKVLWLEADRMGFLLPAVTQEKFEIQRDTVKNERAQRVDNQPYGLRFEKTAEALYSIGHPYSWSTIGYVEDLDRVTVDDLKAFFQRWYGPNNAVLTIGGDIDIKQTKLWVEKYFGRIPKGLEVKADEKQPAILDETRYITLEDRVHLPLLQITFPTVYAYHEDEAALDVLASILGEGKTSILYKNMVKNGLAVQALASHPCRELACEFTILALANPQQVKDLSTLNQIVQDSLAEFEQRKVQTDDLKRVKSAIESNYIYGLQSVQGKVNIMASSEIFKGQPDTVASELARYNNVTAEDVMRVYNKYIKNKDSVVLSVVPLGQTQLAVSEQNFTLPERVFDDSSPAQIELTTVNITDTFDRSIEPNASANKAVSIPEFWEHEFDNGIKMLGVESNETPTLSLTIRIEGGTLLDPLSKIGLASLTAQMLNESTKNFSNEEIANKLSLLGSSISIISSRRYTTIYVDTLTKNAAETLSILQEKMLDPGFLQDDFERLKQRTLQALQQSLKNPSVLASRGRDLILYSSDSRLGLPDSGTFESIQSITLEDIKDFYDKYFRPDHATVVKVGDMNRAEILSLMSFLNDWTSQPFELPIFDIEKDIQKGKLFIVDHPGAVQSIVNIFRHAPVYDPYDEYFKLSLVNFPLGGNFNSRINLNLREDKGYTYGANSRFAGGKQTGVFLASADVTAESTKQSIEEFITEIQKYHDNGMTENELNFLKNAYTQSDALEYETPRQKSSFLSRLLSLELDSDFTSKQQSIINNISTDELNILANKWLKIENMHILVVGDAKTLTESLSNLGRDVVLIEVPR